ncbi:MAG: carboxypeptidase-like regulatory domain-containing protein [Holophagales bacterium]|nr:carboxypeptidase-like regulatory domain-containing protein [Holophagales bacterium]
MFGEPRRVWRIIKLSLILILTAAQAAVAQSGALEGRVVDAASGDPLAAVRVDIVASRSGEDYRANVATNAEGRYRFEDVPEGSYSVYIFEPPAGYLGWIYGGSHCGFPTAQGGCPVDEATLVGVVAGSTATDIDFALPVGGEITGSVTALGTGAAISTEVSLHWAGDAYFGPHLVATVSTDAEGRYRFLGLPTEELFVRTEAIGFLNQTFDNVPCEEFCSPTRSGTPIAAEIGTTVDNVDFVLEPEGILQGRVTNAAGAGVFSAHVRVHRVSDGFEKDVRTMGDGQYTVRRLRPGTYYAQVFAPSASGSVSEIYDSMLCPAEDGSCDVTGGTTIAVASDETTVVDFDLEDGGTLRGRVTDAHSGAPISAFLNVYSSSGEYVTRGFFDPDGRYTVFGLAPGNYYLFASGFAEYQPQVYDGVSCGRSPGVDCDVTVGTPVAVELGEEVVGIDFALRRTDLGACVDSDTGICLNGGRFRVSVTWEDYDGNEGAGTTKVIDLDDSGLFTFFDPDNVELLVKVLDGCEINRAYWFYAAAATDVAYEILVVDTLTGAQRTYSNDLGVRSPAFTDSAAFPCE